MNGIILILIIALIAIVFLETKYKSHKSKTYLEKKLEYLIPKARHHYKRVMGKESKMPYDIRLRVKNLGIFSGMYQPPQFNHHSKTFIDYGIITIDKEALKDKKYAEIVLKHELVHALFNQTDHKEAHHKFFRKIATNLDVPSQFQE